MNRTLILGTVFAFTSGALLTAVALKPELHQLLSPRDAHANAGLYAPRNWQKSSPSKLNMSVFVFGDRNRNGVYDTADKPLNRIAVRLTRPDGSTRIERSNINGFTNFSMQRDGDEADISQTDKNYTFELLPPPGWEVTTKNAIQASSFRAINGAIAGLGANSPPAVVGLAPPATIVGQANTLGTPIQAATKTGDTRELAVDRDGEFQATLASGLWSISGDSDAPARTVSIDYAPVVLSSAVPALRQRDSQPPLVTANFDDIDRSAIEKIASGYAGLSWDYLLAVDNQFYKGPGYVNGLMSGSMVAYNSSGHPVTVSALTPGSYFDFVGGYFSVAWHNAEGETLHIKAWRGDQLVAQDKLPLSHLTPTYFQADYQDITRLQFEAEHYWQFVVDDLQFRLP